MSGVQVLVAGTSGGVGTTTVTALLFAELSGDPAGAPQLLDHSGGELGLRLPEGDEVATVHPELALHDLGPHAEVAAGRLGEPDTVLVLVVPATLVGLAAAETLLDEVGRRHGSVSLRRVVVAVVAVFGSHRIGPGLTTLRDRVGARSVAVIAQDLSLAAGGRIPMIRVTTHTERARRQLGSVLRERVRSGVGT